MSRRNPVMDRLGDLPWFLVLTLVVIAVFGSAILLSAGSTHDAVTGGTEIKWIYALPQITRFMLFLLIAFAFALTPLNVWASLAYPVYFIGVGMLFGVELFGVIVKGASRWLQLGPIRIQPSELMKIAVPLALARYYHQIFQADRRSFWIHIPAFAFIAIPTALVLRQPDLGTALMILATGCCVIFFAGISLRFVGAIVALIAVAAPVAYFFFLHDYQRKRVETLFNPEADPRGAGYQVKQGLIAIGSGGFGGKGYLEGAQKQLDYIPEQHTDFIFTVVAEEFGFVGSIAVLAAFGVALAQGMSIAARSKSAFGALAAAGFVSTLAIYVIVNVGMVVGLLPVVGIPLPLISFGGTVMLTVLIGFGLLMAVHLNATRDLALEGVFTSNSRGA